jgi:hypothetical protein
MKTTTSPPEVRTRAAEATEAPQGITRRRAVPPTGTVRRPAVRIGAARTGTPATGPPATGTPATGTPATGTPATGTPATGTPATGRTAATRTPERRPVRPAGRRATGTPQAPFAVLVVGLLGGALVGLLLLNTALAQQAFTRSELQRENQRLDERKQGLQEDIAREDAPQVLHAKARGLGMRDAEGPAPIDPRMPSAAP